MIHVFTDGASRGNPGKGGWGSIIVDEKENFVFELGGKEENTTNNRMELTAVLEALKKVPKNQKITLYTDSKYVLNGITSWVSGWKANGWKTKTKTAVLNKDIWEKLDALVPNLDVEYKLLPGHSGVVGNERCDEIATAFADGKRINLFEGPLSAYERDILNISIDTEKQGLKDAKKVRSNTKAYSYLSLVDNVLMRHKDWASCEARVKGKKARFKKALSLEDEMTIVSEWGYAYSDIKNAS